MNRDHESNRASYVEEMDGAYFVAEPGDYLSPHGWRPEGCIDPTADDPIPEEATADDPCVEE